MGYRRRRFGPANSTGQSWGGRPHRERSVFCARAAPVLPSTSNRGAPIWVDEVVLDCCNHAFDVAAAHRAGEVRIDHLIYALTRIDEAAEAP